MTQQAADLKEQVNFYTELIGDMIAEKDAISKAQMKAVIFAKAESEGMTSIVKTLIKSMESEAKKFKNEWKKGKNDNAGVNLSYTDKNIPAVTVDNFLEILRNDDKFADVKFNEMTHNPEKNGQPWKDRHTSETVRYIEKNYGIKNDKDLRHALNILWFERTYHPVQDLIKSIEWDGRSRIKRFLVEILETEDTPYAEECSRLIFSCGIARIFDAGCKVDDIVILQGNQGGGKSSVIEWLAMKPEWYTTISNIDGREGMEALKGKWICEISELIAVTKLKEQEAAKAYFTKQTDNYRRPYAEFPEDVPRQCIFIGTTNRRECFTDKTGNRRYYPIWCNASGFDVFDRRIYIEEYIRQCWAEAYQLWKEGKIQHSVDRKLIDVIRQKQRDALEDDPMVGLINDYLEATTNTAVCLNMLWEQALNHDLEHSQPTKKERAEISDLMNSVTNWVRYDKTIRFSGYGSQRAWVRKDSKYFDNMK